MYSRELTTPPEKLIHKGRPVFGTFEGFPDKLDIRGVRTPFANIHLPPFITDFRIRSMINFTFELGPYIGSVSFFDEKVFGYAEVVFWNKENDRKVTYRTFMGPRRRFIPHDLSSGSCSSYKKNKYIRISWDHSRDKLSVVINMKGDSSRPAARATFIAHFSDSATKEITTVIPHPTKRKCSATYMTMAKIHGSISFGQTKLSEATTLKDSEGTATLRINRSYYTIYNKNEYISANGMIDGRNVAFTISQPEEDSVEPDTFNENLLVVDGKCTPLPSVTITHPMGVSKKWVIQDTENMVDLTFTPVSDNYRELSFFLMNSKSHTLYGKFEGEIRINEEESITINNFSGIAKNLLMRL